MTTTDRPHSLTDDQCFHLRVFVAMLRGDITSRQGRTAATLYRAADQQLRGIVPVTLSMRFASQVAGQPGPTIGEVLAAAELGKMVADRARAEAAASALTMR